MSRRPCIRFLAAAAALLLGGCSGDDPLRTGARWTGEYLCLQGRTDLQLLILDRQGDSIRAIFDFNHAPSGAKGGFYLSGTYDSSTAQLNLTPGQWIIRPPGYMSVGMKGTVSRDPARYEGKIDSASCGNFALVPASAGD